MAEFKTTEKIYDEILTNFPDIQRKGKTMPYTSMNGNMFSFVSKVGELAFRLSKEDQQAYIADYGATLSIQYNSVMHGYINVPEKYFKDKVFLNSLCEKSIANAKNLKPKPTTKKKK